MDKEGFLYTTDVGAHTVSKWRISGDGKFRLLWLFRLDSISYFGGSSQEKAALEFFSFASI